MIYQLAKTSPLLSGQVKINFILKGSQVDSIQYTPISPSIPFNYNNPEDVLNYSHGDNVKMLHNKIGDSFYSTIGNSKLNPTKLHRFVELYDDTHDNTYEMGMKRLEYHKFNKQFEFFCPFWCDNKNEFNDIKFEICVVNKNGRTLYAKIIEFSDTIKKYLNTLWDNLNTNNEELLYIGFEKCESYIKGLNVMSGDIQTIDTSYIIDNITSQERTILETDNLITNLFAQNNLVATQLFNFSFVFGLEDFIPLNLINDFIGERINVYVNMYSNNKKVEVKDIYSNYEQISKYNIEKGDYVDSENVIEYLHDNHCIDIIDKNKLVQSTFHWTLRNNTSSIFNLYNGFAPFCEEQNGSRIQNNETDMFTDKFDISKNPLSMFKYTDRTDIPINSIDIVKHIENKSSYYLLDFTTKNEYQWFGNILIDNKKIKRSSIKSTLSRVTKFYCGVTLVKNTMTESILENVIGEKWTITPVKTRQFNKKTYYIWKKDDSTNEFFLMIVIRDLDDIDLKDLLYFNGFVKQKSFKNGLGNKYPTLLESLSRISDILESATIYPTRITIYKSIHAQKTNSPSILTNEIEYRKYENCITLYRYSTNLIPCFIDLDDTIRRNKVYWVKQFNNDLYYHISNEDDIDHIEEYIKNLDKKFKPLYPSIDYFALNKENVDYNHYYLDVHDTNSEQKYHYKKEKSWFKSNLMLYLKENFVVYKEIPSYAQITDNMIVNILKKEISNTDDLSEEDFDNLIKYYIKDLYTWKYKYDYVKNDINKQIVQIEFTLK